MFTIENSTSKAKYLLSLNVCNLSECISFQILGFYPLFCPKKPTSESGIEKWLKKFRKATLMIYKMPSSKTILLIPNNSL